MKRIFYSLMVAAVSMTAYATDYTDQIKVLINGEGTVQQATISVNQHGGLYDFNLKNFVLMNGSEPMYVGNVEVKDVKPEAVGGATFLRTNQNITITEGNLPDVAAWVGPMLGELPVQITAVLKDNTLRALIDLDLSEKMGQVVNVSFGEALVSGTGYHIPNADFEAWHVSKDDFEEPNAWHSFESGTGALISLVGHHLEKSSNGRNGSTCARIYSTAIFGVVANGTMTTGRMNAGHMTATNSANHAYLDMSQTDVDGNGDPFWVAMNSHPDSLVLWMQFKQATANANYPYASVTAIITDGVRYQVPEDKTYDNVMARAINNNIPVTGDKWTRISIPFNYINTSVQPKGIIITISTNATPGQGSSGDEVLVDDIEMVYNSRLSSLNVDGFRPDVFEYTTTKDLNSIQAVADGQGAYVLKSTDGGKVTFDVFSNDLRSHNAYVVSDKSQTEGITTSHFSPLTSQTFNIKGQRVDGSQRGQVVIVRQSDGRVVKVLK